MVKNLPANAGDVRDTGLVPGLGRSPGGGHGNPLQYSFLGNLHEGKEPGRLQSIESYMTKVTFSTRACMPRIEI